MPTTDSSLMCQSMSNPMARDEDMVWLKNYLEQLSDDVDGDVLTEYIAGVICDTTLSKTDIYAEVESILSAYLPTEASKSASIAISNHFMKEPDPNKDLDGSDPTCVASLEESMRCLMQANYNKQLTEAAEREQKKAAECERDACTQAVLRAAGVAGYQGDSEDEKDMELAIANAEFHAKQLLDLDAAAPADAAMEVMNVNLDSADNEIDIEELEQISGYAKTDDVKPGTVEDALSFLNPTLFGQSHTTTERRTVTRLPTPGDRPKGFIPPTILPYVAAPPVPPARTVEETEQEVVQDQQKQKKKKSSAPPKHIAKVGALAEARKKSDQSKFAADGNPGSSARGAVRARQDEMDAFLFSDNDSESDSKAILPQKQDNRSAVEAAERNARQMASVSHAQRKSDEKASRAKQLEEAKQRKENAQKRAQKVERRR